MRKKKELSVLKEIRIFDKVFPNIKTLNLQLSNKKQNYVNYVYYSILVNICVKVVFHYIIDLNVW